MPDGLERIGVHLPSLLAYMVNLLVLLGVLYAIAYRPFLRVLHERAERIQQGLAKAQEAELVLSQGLAEGDRLVQEARLEAQRVLAAAQGQAEVELAQARARARQEADAYLDTARRLAEQERRQTSLRLQRECGELVVLATQKVVGRTLDWQLHREVVQEAIREVLAMDWAGRPRRSPLYARVTSAVPLTPEELAKVSRAANGLVGKPLPLLESVEPCLVGGLTLALGDTVLDASLNGRLRLLHQHLQL